jgi:8-oxo-dGTP diphosphatase
MHTKKISISVALIQDGSSYICLKRKNKLYNNYIEFPGGKLLPQETEQNCLIREIKEELDINVTKFKFIGVIKHLYDDLLIKINVFKIFKYDGHIHSHEAREIIMYNSISKFNILPTHHRILKLVKLPRILKILTIDDFNNNEVLDITHYGSLRLRGISYDFYKKYIKNILISQKFSGNIIIDYPYNTVWEDHYHGIHFTSNNLDCYDQCKKDSRIIYSASCHTKEDINLCNKKLFDFILLSPVLRIHNMYSALKWSRFSELSEYSYLPTYALGGLSSQTNDYEKCIEHNGFGIAGISRI